MLPSTVTGKTYYELEECIYLKKFAFPLRITSATYLNRCVGGVFYARKFFSSISSPSPHATGERSSEGGSLSSSHFAFQVKYYGNDDDYKKRNE